jgi:hypothetical protein
MKSSTIDLLLFQDGIGEKKLRLSDLPKYYAALLDAVRGVGAGVGGVVNCSASCRMVSDCQRPSTAYEASLPWRINYQVFRLSRLRYRTT